MKSATPMCPVSKVRYSGRVQAAGPIWREDAEDLAQASLATAGLWEAAAAGTDLPAAGAHACRILASAVEDVKAERAGLPMPSQAPRSRAANSMPPSPRSRPRATTRSKGRGARCSRSATS